MTVRGHGQPLLKSSNSSTKQSYHAFPNPGKYPTNNLAVQLPGSGQMLSFRYSDNPKVTKIPEFFLIQNMKVFLANIFSD